jgi:hypothetical protein
VGAGRVSTWWHDDARFIYMLVIDAVLVMNAFFLIAGGAG